MDLQCINTIDCKQGAVRAVRFNVDGSYCLTCGSDKKIKLWNPYRGLMLKIYGGHGNEVLDAAGSNDNSQIISGSADKSVITWDVSTGAPLRRLRGHASGITCVKYNEESSVGISGSLDNTVMIWDLKSRRQEPVQILNQAKDCINSIQVTDHEILTGSVDCSIRRYDIRNRKLHSDFIGAPIMSVNYTSDGQCIVVGSSDDTVRLIDKNTGEMLGEYLGHKTEDLNVESALLASDNHILSGSVTGELWCWDLVSGKVVKRFEHTIKKVLNSVSTHPVKDVVLTASVNTIKLWEVSEIKEDS
ncbi:PREDICTED: WD repeat domain-containing protein 83 isoform X1 [Nicrophorus vespilloides]|uniref:WD repeat domain-containing protein 83 n=2 Tax=Nicrophorus vespilloides TaxID=110193 RepID=A0ABM1MJY6_NICVS|nr:PREDICTED: WD repeat domain-containing protein 83 isoform X1 [Nicrophorus vespilloides]XP_017774887.1 PREDICTED: WD repeat domain-containing protein 83 isoform X1 [Nicrophorus vespilloides]